MTYSTLIRGEVRNGEGEEFFILFPSLKVDLAGLEPATYGFRFVLFSQTLWTISQPTTLLVWVSRVNAVIKRALPLR